MAKAAANSVKNKPLVGKPWPKGVSGNPKGRPPDGESWAAIIREVGNMTGNDVAEWFDAYRKDCERLGKVQFKHAIVARVFLDLLHEPKAALFNAIMDRAEGKLAQPVGLSWQKEIEGFGGNPEELERAVAEALAAREAGAGGGGDEADAAG
jgi:hypothetical protein